MKLLERLHDLVRDREAHERIEREICDDREKRRRLLIRIRAIEMSVPVKYDRDNPPSDRR